jgi:hypothetical protein
MATFRGEGIYQAAIDFAIEKLCAGAWVRPVPLFFIIRVSDCVLVLARIMNVVLTRLFYILFNVDDSLPLQWPYPDGNTPPSYDHSHCETQVRPQYSCTRTTKRQQKAMGPHVPTPPRNPSAALTFHRLRQAHAGRPSRVMKVFASPWCPPECDVFVASCDRARHAGDGPVHACARSVAR